MKGPKVLIESLPLVKDTYSSKLPRDGPRYNNMLLGLFNIQAIAS